MGVMGQRKDQRLALSVYLALGTLLVWLRVLRCGSVNYDDAVYMGHPLVKAGLTWKGIVWAFTGIHSSNWHPLTTISHMLDAQLFGGSIFAAHAVNLLLHISSTVLLFLILTRATKAQWPSLFVAALFALHPLHVESVAWIAERKDVLSTLFWMLTMLAYVLYAEHPSQRRFYWVVGLYAVGLMCKPMLVSLPFVLLLLDYWPLRRSLESEVSSQKKSASGWHEVSALAVEKWPLFGMAAVSCVITAAVQSKGGASVALGQLPLWLRLENALIAYVAYIGKMFWPAKLAVFYPYPTQVPALWKPLGALVLLGGVSVGVWKSWARHPYLAVGWLWFLGTLVPVIGIVQVGEQSMADRYTYVPLIGLFIMIAWGSMGGWERGSVGDGRSEHSTHKKVKGKKHDPAINHQPSTILLWSAGLVLLVLAVCTWRQIGFWQDRYTLFSHALDVTANNYVAHDMVGAELNAQGKYMDAIRQFSRAIQIRTNDDTAYNGLGNAFTRLGKYPEAVGAYDAAIRVRPGFPLAYFNEGIVLVLQGQVNQAIDRFEAVEKINSGPRAHLEMFAGDEAKNDKQIARTEDALRRTPDDPAVKCAYAIALAQRGRIEDAISQLEDVSAMAIEPEVLAAKLHATKPAASPVQVSAAQAAVKKNPKDPIAHFQLGNAYNQSGKRQDAIREYREAIRLKPSFGRAHNNLAVALYFTGDYAGAWKEVHITQKQGAEVHPKFIQALAEKMPEPPK